MQTTGIEIVLGILGCAFGSMWSWITYRDVPKGITGSSGVAIYRNKQPIRFFLHIGFNLLLGIVIALFGLYKLLKAMA